MLLDHQVDIVLAGAARLYGRNNGSWRRELACIGQATAQSFFFLISRVERRSFTPGDLIGKELILFPGSPTPWLCLQHILKSAGIDPLAVRILRYETVDTAIREFLAGRGDYIELPEPYADDVATRYKNPQIVSVAKLLGPVPFTIFLVTRRTIKRFPDQLQQFIGVIGRAQTWLREHSADEVAIILAPFFPEIDLNLVTHSVARYQLQDQWGSSPIISPYEFDYLGRVLTGTSGVREEPFAEIVDMRFALQ